jgi:D-alanyl-lipoteichoic acid acyltransferase DltB (MBOAT superfamily)
MKTRNIIIIFVVSGFWHGANWTFIVWGFLNALYFIPLLLRKKNRLNMEVVAYQSKFPSLKEFAQILFTFFLTLIAWVFFRSENVSHAFAYLTILFSPSLFIFPVINKLAIFPMLFTLIFIIVEWMGRRDEYAIQNIFAGKPKYIRWSFYYAIAFAVIALMGQAETFIYFQF